MANGAGASGSNDVSLRQIFGICFTPVVVGLIQEEYATGPQREETFGERRHFRQGSDVDGSRAAAIYRVAMAT